MRSIVTLTCTRCKCTFSRLKSTHEQAMRRGRKIYCSPRCNSLTQQEQGTQTVTCDWCNASVIKVNSQISKHNFCNRSCAASYNNAHKTHGIRRSKLEIWLEGQLQTLYPSLEILFNRKEAINSELDIYFPALNLAFELNGIFHYEPIYGPEKLASIQNNDHRKFAACAEKGIELCILDVSTMNYFKPTKGQKFLDIITNIIDAKLAVS